MAIDSFKGSNGRRVKLLQTRDRLHSGGLISIGGQKLLKLLNI